MPGSAGRFALSPQALYPQEEIRRVSVSMGKIAPVNLVSLDVVCVASVGVPEQLTAVWLLFLASFPDPAHYAQNVASKNLVDHSE